MIEGENEVLLRLGLALLLGMLVGLQRERGRNELAGIRTFALVGLFGAVCSMLSESFGFWFPVVGLGAVALTFVISNAFTEKTAGGFHPRTTTEVAALLMFAVGAYIMQGSLSIGMVLGGTLAILLYSKARLRTLLEGAGPGELRAIIQFVLIALVILPILPDRNFGPYLVLNPYEAWLMVVLIVGLSLGGYLAYRIIGASAGMLVGGLLGGLISSTATTVSYARQSKSQSELGALAAFVIAAASTVVYARLLIEIAVVAPDQLRAMAPPLGIMFCLGAGLAAFAFFQARSSAAIAPPKRENPAELQAAIAFGALYVLVLLAVAFARDRFGDLGVYFVALLSGLTDVDAITLSTTRLVDAGRLSVDTGWRTVLLASLSNMGFKFGAVLLLGSRDLSRRFALYAGGMFVGGGLLLWLWPVLS